VNALARLGKLSRKELTKFLVDHDPNVRFYALRAVAPESFDDDLVKPLIKLLINVDDIFNMHEDICSLISKVGPKAIAMAPALIAYWKRGARDSYRANAALAAMGAPVVPLLIHELEKKEQVLAPTESIHLYALQTISMVGTGASSASRAVSRLLAAQNQSVRFQAALTLLAIGEAPAAVIDVLEEIADSQDEERQDRSHEPSLRPADRRCWPSIAESFFRNDLVELLRSRLGDAGWSDKRLLRLATRLCESHSYRWQLHEVIDKTIRALEIGGK
jgi:HEAT repeat protein